MKHRYIAFLLLFASALPALASDQAKAEKELRKVVAMASDPTGRRVVSESVSEMLNVPRPQLVMERRNLGLNYSQVFLLHEMASAGGKLEDLQAELKAGKSVADLAKSHSLDWKKTAVDAKQLNAKIEDDLYHYFISGQKLAERDAADHYSVTVDGVKQDNEGITQADLEEAQRTYVMYKDRVSQMSAKAKRMGTVEENTFRQDQARTMPTDQNSGNTGPATTPSGPK